MLPSAAWHLSRRALLLGATALAALVPAAASAAQYTLVVKRVTDPLLAHPRVPADAPQVGM